MAAGGKSALIGPSAAWTHIDSMGAFWQRVSIVPFTQTNPTMMITTPWVPHIYRRFRCLGSASQSIQSQCIQLCRSASSTPRRLKHSAPAKSSTMENEEGDSGVRFHAIDNVEGFWRYSKGGYHPVGIGDRLNARYRILDKLGHGGYSTVWLARDETLQRLVAVKVCTADASPREVEILNFLGNSPPPVGFASLGRDMMPSLLDSFSINGPHGTHTCIVTALARCTLDQAREASWGQPFRLDVARSLAAQLAIAVAYLHEKGIVHGGR